MSWHDGASRQGVCVVARCNLTAGRVIAFLDGYPAGSRALHRPERPGVGGAESQARLEPAHGQAAARWAADSLREPVGRRPVVRLDGDDATDLPPLPWHPLRRRGDPRLRTQKPARLQHHTRDAAAGGSATARAVQVPVSPGSGPLAGRGTGR